jgi:hypothetical protein
MTLLPQAIELFDNPVLRRLRSFAPDTNTHFQVLSPFWRHPVRELDPAARLAGGG